MSQPGELRQATHFLHFLSFLWILKRQEMQRLPTAFSPALSTGWAQKPFPGKNKVSQTECGNRTVSNHPITYIQRVQLWGRAFSSQRAWLLLWLKLCHLPGWKSHTCKCKTVVLTLLSSPLSCWKEKFSEKWEAGKLSVNARVDMWWERISSYVASPDGSRTPVRHFHHALNKPYWAHDYSSVKGEVFIKKL